MMHPTTTIFLGIFVAVVGQFSSRIFFGPSFCLGFYLFSMDFTPVCVKFIGTNYSTEAF